MPGPGKYSWDRHANSGPSRGVKFSDAKVPDAITQAVNMKREIPGPSHYSPSPIFGGGGGGGGGGGKFSDADLPDFITMAVRRSKEIPGQKYYPNKSLDWLESGGSGKFSDAQTPDFITQVIREKRDIPGPSKYIRNDPKGSIYNRNADWTVNPNQISTRADV